LLVAYGVLAAKKGVLRILSLSALLFLNPVASRCVPQNPVQKA